MKKQNSIKLDHVTPRQLLCHLAALALFAASGGSVLAADTATVKPEESLKRLQDGNERFVAGTPTQTTKDAKRRAEVAQGQKPFAIVVSCSDSRVGPEVRAANAEVNEPTPHAPNGPTTERPILPVSTAGEAVVTPTPDQEANPTTAKERRRAEKRREREKRLYQSHHCRL